MEGIGPDGALRHRRPPGTAKEGETVDGPAYGVPPTGDVEPGELPAPLAGRAALEALQRLSEAIAPTQGELAIKAGTTGRLLASERNQAGATAAEVVPSSSAIVATASMTVHSSSAGPP
ncbi:hypothetical protein ACIBO5_12755 [Nonomuraea angiospora]|uniref:hypothetical protein n=1 Tax=Nonomuraea angiospora TaxID=46172 RepID=UPI00378F1485